MENAKSADRVADMCALATQQRRLRHLRSLAARNVQLKKERTPLDVTQLQMFFTLHANATSPSFYTSEKIRGSLNPVWKSFGLIHLNEEINIDTTSQSLTVRVWHGQVSQPDANYDCCIRWDVSLSGLAYLGNKIMNDRSQHAPNTLIFGLRDGFYGAPTVGSTDASDRTICWSVEAEASLVRKSYNSRSLMRVQTVLRAIKQTQRGVARERRAINSRLLDLENLRRKKSQREATLLKVKMMHDDLQWRMTQLQGLEKSYEKLQVDGLHRGVSLRKRFDQLNRDTEDLHERKKRYFDVRDELIKTGAQLVLRRKQLLSELAFIYPIQRLPNSEDRICGIHLPHSEDFPGHDETQIAVALGYTSHLILMISNFLDVPLRYPMDHRGSKSMIHDHIIDKLTEKERDFPLFSKGRERFQFQYGVFIMNKNIAQLRHYCGMSTPDLRQTLANISTLLCDRLGITMNLNDAFSNQHHLIPPSFGGPQKSSQMPHGQAYEAETPKKASVQPPIDLSFSSSSQADLHLQEIEEEGTDVQEHSSEIRAATISVGSSDAAYGRNVAEAETPQLPFQAKHSDTEQRESSDTHSQLALTGKVPNGGTVDPDFLVRENGEHKTCLPEQSAEGLLSPRSLNDSSSRENLNLVKTTDVAFANEFDASSTEDLDSLIYQSHFPKWDGQTLSQTHQRTLQRSPDPGQEHGNDHCDASQAYSQQQQQQQQLYGAATAAAFGDAELQRTFKTWGTTSKNWRNQWNESDAENSAGIEGEKFSDSETLDC